MRILKNDCKYYTERLVVDFDGEKLKEVGYEPYCMARECIYPERECKARRR